jgi:hypothetical protein
MHPKEKDEEEKQEVELYVCNVHGYQLDMNREGERHIWKSPISGDKRAGEGGGGSGGRRGE